MIRNVTKELGIPSPHVLLPAHTIFAAEVLRRYNVVIKNRTKEPRAFDHAAVEQLFHLKFASFLVDLPRIFWQQGCIKVQVFWNFLELDSWTLRAQYPGLQATDMYPWVKPVVSDFNLELVEEVVPLVDDTERSVSLVDELTAESRLDSRDVQSYGISYTETRLELLRQGSPLRRLVLRSLPLRFFLQVHLPTLGVLMLLLNLSLHIYEFLASPPRGTLPTMAFTVV